MNDGLCMKKVGYEIWTPDDKILYKMWSLDTRFYGIRCKSFSIDVVTSKVDILFHDSTACLANWLKLGSKGVRLRFSLIRFQSRGEALALQITFKREDQVVLRRKSDSSCYFRPFYCLPNFSKSALFHLLCLGNRNVVNKLIKLLRLTSKVTFLPLNIRMQIQFESCLKVNIGI